MPTTPQVNFSFKNENVQVSTPQLGISHVLARTTKGKFNDPSEIITSYPQFQRIFGEEIVPDGSVSNIKKALSMGAKLRISRVAGNEASYGVLHDSDSVNPISLSIDLIRSTSGVSQELTLNFKMRSKEQGSLFYDKYNKLYTRFSLSPVSQDKEGNYVGPYRLMFSQYYASTAKKDSLVDQKVFMAWNMTQGSQVMDVKSLMDFVNSVPNVDIYDVEWVSGDGSESESGSIYDFISWLSNNSDFVPKTPYTGAGGLSDILNPESDNTATPNILDMGSDGGASTALTWETAYNAISEYNDAYNLILSHVHQHLPNNGAYIEVYKTIADLVRKSQEVKLLIELPKPSSPIVTDQEWAAYLTSLIELVTSVGQSPILCYYGGGIKYYDSMGIIKDCDVLGTVLGLASVSESTYGPWYSYAGQNRGIVPDALGPVMPNLGPSSKKDRLQEFANYYMNLFVIKDTASAGKRTMLWHNFTSNPTSNSYKFISIVNLNLYLKKSLRPILESKLEEPNTFSTWKDIYYKVKPILDDLVNRNALTNWVWNGDQDAQSYSELQVNTEADVRAGKYKVILSYQDIVTLQEVSMEINIDSTEQDISISM